VVEGRPETPRLELGEIRLADTFHPGGPGLGHIPLGTEVSERSPEILDHLDLIFVAPTYCHRGILTLYSSLVIMPVPVPATPFLPIPVGTNYLYDDDAVHTPSRLVDLGGHNKNQHLTINGPTLTLDR
jgi:hypothetical protein